MAAARGRVSGVIERVATGAKEAFTGKEAIGRVIGRMLPDSRPRLRVEATFDELLTVTIVNGRDCG